MKYSVSIFLLFASIFFSSAGQDPYNDMIPESIYVHTDKDIYIAGEYLFYAMYLRSSQDQASRYAYLLLRDNKSSTLIQARLEIKEKRSYGSIFLPDTLASAYYQIVCFTNLMRNNEEIIFKKEILIANRFDEKLTAFSVGTIKKGTKSTEVNFPVTSAANENLLISPGKYVFQTRDTITFTISPKDFKSDSIARISVSVSEIFPGDSAESSISDFFFTDTERLGEIHANNNKNIYLAEFSNPVIQGKIRFLPDQPEDNNKSDRQTSVNKINPVIYLSAPDTIPNLQYAEMDSTGSFYFRLDPYYDGKEIFIRMKEKANGVIELDRKSNIIQSFSPSFRYNVPGIKEYLLRNSKIVQVQRFYNKKDLLDTERIDLTFKPMPRVYHKNYLKILPADYLELPDFLEISREILPSFKIRKSRGSYFSDYGNLGYQTVTEDEPTIFLDGVTIDDVGQIITLGSKDIKNIVTVPFIRFYGDLVFKGILAVTTNMSAINNIQFKSPAIRYQVPDCQSFTRPELFEPSSLPGHYPDLRQVLLWEPELKPERFMNKELRCYSSDLKGTFRISVRGVTYNGYPVSGSALISVVSK